MFVPISWLESGFFCGFFVALVSGNFYAYSPWKSVLKKARLSDKRLGSNVCHNGHWQEASVIFTTDKLDLPLPIVGCTRTKRVGHAMRSQKVLSIGDRYRGSNL